MTQVCPVNYRQVNENVARFNAFFILLFVSLYFLTNAWIIIVFLLFDFFIRGFLEGRKSPLKALSKMLTKKLRIKPLMIDGAPKEFAAKIGFSLICLMIVFIIFELVTFTIITGSMLLFFSFLESIFGFCVACRLYPFIFHFNKKC